MFLVPAIVLVMAAHCFAAEDFAVSVGSSSWEATEASSHDISRDALETGQKNFEVSSSEGNYFRFQLSEKQIGDILAGSTVVVETGDGGRKVWISPKRKKPVSSGW